MANPLAPVSRTLNKMFASRGFRCTASIVGSFVAVRIEDPEGKVTVADATKVEFEAAHVLTEFGAILTTTRSMGIRYHFGGVVMNWERA